MLKKRLHWIFQGPMDGMGPALHARVWTFSGSSRGAASRGRGVGAQQLRGVWASGNVPSTEVHRIRSTAVSGRWMNDCIQAENEQNQLIKTTRPLQDGPWTQIHRRGLTTRPCSMAQLTLRVPGDPNKRIHFPLNSTRQYRLFIIAPAEVRPKNPLHQSCGEEPIPRLPRWCPRAEMTRLGEFTAKKHPLAARLD